MKIVTPDSIEEFCEKINFENDEQDFLDLTYLTRTAQDKALQIVDYNNHPEKYPLGYGELLDLERQLLLKTFYRICN
jgi:hypothetical protein